VWEAWLKFSESTRAQALSIPPFKTLTLKTPTLKKPGCHPEEGVLCPTKNFCTLLPSSMLRCVA
jgi:hypothetical protein